MSFRNPSQLTRPRAPVRRTLRWSAGIVATCFLVLGIVLLVRTSAVRSKQIHVPPVAVNVDANLVAEHLAEAVRFKTVSVQFAWQLDDSPFIPFHDFLRRTYPHVHSTLRREEVTRFSLLYTWPGTDPSLAPVLLLAHQDVVPAEDESAWKHGPFSGDIADGAVWGRGSCDDKGSLIAVFEAVEKLLSEGYQPQRTIYLALGHDEEIGGTRGAAAMAQLLAERGVRPLFTLDEGGAITQGIVAGISKPVALIGIAEKGYVTLELKVNAAGGHSSMPPAHTAVGELAGAIHRLEAHPFPASVSPTTRQMLEYLAPEMPFGRRTGVANLWLLEPLVRRQIGATPAGAASLRTTTAATMFEAGVKENVLPSEARAYVNFRIIPGETIDSVIARVRAVISDENVHISKSASFSSDPSPVSDVTSEGFGAVQRSLAEVAPDAVAAPSLVLGGTDSRHYTNITPCVLRFVAARRTPQDLPTIHGNNEKQSIENCGLMVKFYIRLLKNTCG